MIRTCGVRPTHSEEWWLPGQAVIFAAHEHPDSYFPTLGFMLTGVIDSSIERSPGWLVLDSETLHRCDDYPEFVDLMRKSGYRGYPNIGDFFLEDGEHFMLLKLDEKVDW